MSVELLNTLSLIAYILAGFFFVLALVLFFRLKVPALWGEVSGRTARKAIEAMKWKGEEAAAKPAELKPLTSEKAPLIAAEQKPPRKDAPEVTEKDELGVAEKDAELGHTDVLPSSGQTAILAEPSESGETAVLSAAAYSEFVVRSTGELPRKDETTLLGQAQSRAQSADIPVIFVLEKELAFTDSTEIIE